jgi:hypothetical protein
MGAIILAPALAIMIFECLLRVECVRVRHFYSGRGVESSIGQRVATSAPFRGMDQEPATEEVAL